MVDTVESHYPVNGSRLRRLLAIFVAAIVIAVGLLAASAQAPAERLNARIAARADVLFDEGNNPVRRWLWGSYVGDNYTDAWMLSIAMIDRDGSPTLDTLQGAYFGPEDAPFIGGAVSALRDRLATSANANKQYLRYWHGYVVALRPLFLVFDYLQVRLFNLVALSTLALSVVVSLARRAGAGAAVAFIVAWLLVAPTVIAGNLQYVSVFYISMIGMLGVLALGTRRQPESWDVELFLSLGMATSFFDFLTAPLVTWGLPILTLLALVRSQTSHGGLPRLVVRSAGAWGIGYVAFWAAKWVLGMVFAGPQALADAAGAVSGHTVEGSDLLGRFQTIAINFGRLVPTSGGGIIKPTAQSAIPAGVALLLACTLWFVIWRMSRAPIRNASVVATILVVGVAPYVWYVLAAPHSSGNNFFTFRAQAVTVFALGLAAAYSIDWRALSARSRA